jgi:hypothetical protein
VPLIRPRDLGLLKVLSNKDVAQMSIAFHTKYLDAISISVHQGFDRVLEAFIKRRPSAFVHSFAFLCMMQNIMMSLNEGEK